MLEVMVAIYKMVKCGNESWKAESTPEECVEHIFRNMDTDQNGNISEAEFIVGIQSNSSSMALLQMQQIFGK